MTPIQALEKLVEARKKATAGEWQMHDVTDDGEVISRGIEQVGGKGLNRGDEYELFGETDADFIALAGSVDLPAIMAAWKADREALANEYARGVRDAAEKMKQLVSSTTVQEHILSLLDGKGASNAPT